MTSSHNLSSDSSASDNPDALDNATQNVEATDRLIDSIENLDAKNKEIIEETLVAKSPEPEITMTSPSPDVVIATVEDPKSTDDLETTIQSSIKNDLKDDKLSLPAGKNSPKNSDLDAESETQRTTTTNPIASADKLSSTVKDGDDSDSVTVAASFTDDEDEVIEEKEAKLESYKQFVAEQFNNKKVDYPEVRVRIEANALPSKMYFIMNILSAIIASYGLVTNSAAVVIGAMLVAMMLGPITGVALAIIDHRGPLLRKSLFTVAAGISLVVLVGFVVGWLHNDQPLTSEILSRTQPTSMDLMIALAGGTAGAYAMVSPHLSVAVVGVAVATALVPPLAASGILFANGEGQLGLGALLLAITNIIAIQFTNALVLWVLGFGFSSSGKR